MRNISISILFVFITVLAGAAASGQDNSVCMNCHGEKDLTGTRGGVTKSMFVDAKQFAGSAHGSLECAACHGDLQGSNDFPHKEDLEPVYCGSCHDEPAAQMTASVHGEQIPTGARQHRVSCSDCHGTHAIYPSTDPRSNTFHLTVPKLCSKCHGSGASTTWQEPRLRKAYDFYARSIHGKALLQWQLELAADCVDCHGYHDIRSFADPKSHVNRTNIVGTCGRCHTGAVQAYNQGVHGQAFASGVLDSAVCTDCHNEHGVISPLDKGSNVYLTAIVNACARCHADKEIVTKYGVSVEAVTTYQQSYHGIGTKYGSTVIANCVSCHRYHDIKPPQDPSSSINPGNLRETCGQPRCHTNATEDFVRGKIHTPVTVGQEKAVSIVRIFYFVVICMSVAGMFAHNLLHLRNEMRRRRASRNRHEP